MRQVCADLKISTSKEPQNDLFYTQTPQNRHSSPPMVIGWSYWLSCIDFGPDKDLRRLFNWLATKWCDILNLKHSSFIFLSWIHSQSISILILSCTNTTILCKYIQMYCIHWFDLHYICQLEILESLKTKYIYSLACQNGEHRKYWNILNKIIYKATNENYSHFKISLIFSA